MVRFWVVRMTIESLENNALDWEIGKNKNFIGIGGKKIGDLTSYTTKEGLKTLKNKLNDFYKPKTVGTLNNWVSHYNSFINRIKEDDIVFLPIYPEHDVIYWKKYLVGKVKSRTYYKKENQDNARATLRRDVEWMKEITQLSDRLQKSLESPHTVYNIDKHKREIQTFLKDY